LISFLQGVQAAANLGIGKLILETDALMVQQAMRSDTFDAMPEGALVEELKFLARVNFIDFECNFLSRVGNRAAHAMAALGYGCIEGEELLTSSVPEDVLVIVSDDLDSKNVNVVLFCPLVRFKWLEGVNSLFKKSTSFTNQ
jgi:hypothetical protein